MKELKRAIAALDQEISTNRQLISAEYQQFKANLAHKIISPTTFIIAFIGGGLLGKSFKNNLKNQRALPSKTSPIKTKFNFLEKILALSSEISVAFNLFNRFKNLLTHLSKNKHAYNK